MLFTGTQHFRSLKRRFFFMSSKVRIFQNSSFCISMWTCKCSVFEKQCHHLYSQMPIVVLCNVSETMSVCLPLVDQ